MLTSGGIELTICGLPFFVGCFLTRMFPGCGSQCTNPHENVMADMVDIARSMTSRKFNPMPSIAVRSFRLRVSENNVEGASD